MPQRVNQNARSAGPSADLPATPHRRNGRAAQRAVQLDQARRILNVNTKGFDPAKEANIEEAMYYKRAYEGVPYRVVAQRFKISYLTLWRRVKGRGNMLNRGGHNTLFEKA